MSILIFPFWKWKKVSPLYTFYYVFALFWLLIWFSLDISAFQRFYKNLQMIILDHHSRLIICPFMSVAFKFVPFNSIYKGPESLGVYHKPKLNAQLFNEGSLYQFRNVASFSRNFIWPCLFLFCFCMRRGWTLMIKTLVKIFLFSHK